MIYIYIYHILYIPGLYLCLVVEFVPDSAIFSSCLWFMSLACAWDKRTKPGLMVCRGKSENPIGDDDWGSPMSGNLCITIVQLYNHSISLYI